MIGGKQDCDCCVFSSVFRCFFAFFLYVNNFLIDILLMPLRNQLPANTFVMVSNPTTVFFAPLHLAVYAALLTTLPYGLWEIWQFIRPGLYLLERHRIRFLMGISFILLSLGVLFCYFLALPWMFQLLVWMHPKNIQLFPDLGVTLAFILRMLMFFGLTFELPVMCLALVWLQVLSAAQLRRARPYVIVSAFTLGMLLTPPDVVSQIILALPLCLLYEISLWTIQRFQT